jgi:membrane protein YqaA with SNARE-associated domain
MKQLAAAVERFAFAIGGPGLFLVSFLDSSVMSLPNVTDLLIVLLTLQRPDLMLLYAASTVVGSVAGCFVLYGIGRTGGDAFMRKRFSQGAVERATRWFREYGLFAVAVPAILPPPTPFKLFVLLAGAARVHPATFALAVAAGRGVRYFGMGFLALWVGEAAMQYMRDHGSVVSIVLAALLIVGGAVWAMRRRRAAPGPPDGRRAEPAAGATAGRR